MSPESQNHHQRRGPSSYAMQDPERLWQILEPRPGQAWADLGCGPGDYALEAARRVGPDGKVWALDRDQLMLDALEEKARQQDLANLTTMASDLRKPLPCEITAWTCACWPRCCTSSSSPWPKVRCLARCGASCALAAAWRCSTAPWPIFASARPPNCASPPRSWTNWSGPTAWSASAWRTWASTIWLCTAKNDRRTGLPSAGPGSLGREGL
ncbi:MAG: methyltransferase domain-containing protein [Desulfarculus sp.]|nr:methyltransferase domain-containing protein [Pseudomonadota bacterium]MBV1714995.1 methyltransferase domain-containing protein [Desulfarculus sp.]MBU4573862.1 methyltransferase domain-containing protein [Pseudomonadota bacterium]MBU4598952.1 methyltransferase domain-containing protein [Pseudomonadota bacterium]MBV1737495.1 methyltransferase domain-containing protein [Desulfarculus sp.]